MSPTKNEYKKKVEKVSPNSSITRNCVFAFLVGGAICTLGQGINELFMHWGLGITDSANVTAITLVFLGALLTGLNVYDNIASFAGAGSIVPITGFANAIVAPALEYKSEGLVLGVGNRMFTIAGPVLVYGITSSVLYGLVLVLIGKGA